MGVLTHRGRKATDTAPDEGTTHALSTDVFTLNEDASSEQIEWVAGFERERGKQAYARAEQLEGWAAQVRGRS